LRGASARERLHQVLYEKSYRRLKRHGLGDDEARRIAAEVALQATGRLQAPDFKADTDFAGVVTSVCKGLSEGRSYYELMAERPYLATGRIDRLVATAGHVRPQVPAELALAARRATGLERLSGGLAVLFSALALVALGVWYALAAGVVVSIGGEIYVQTGMPASARRAFAHYRLPRVLGVLAFAALGYFGYGWVIDSDYGIALSVGLAAFAVLVAFVIPGLALASLVGRRESRWREALEKKLVDEGRDGPGS
jgi:hypothetical protein